MNTIDILSVDGVKRVIGDFKPRTKTVAWHSSTIKVKQFITIEEYMNVVHKIIEECQTPDGGIELEMVDFSIKANIISSYAYIELPQDINELYFVIYGTDLYKTVCMVANNEQVNSVYKAVDLYIGA